jgi:hypothetical protein
MLLMKMGFVGFLAPRVMKGQMQLHSHCLAFQFSVPLLI